MSSRLISFAPTAMKKTKRKKNKHKKKRKTFELRPVYDDPDHELLATPAKKLRASKGETVADFLVFGDDISWGVSHQLFRKEDVDENEEMEKPPAVRVDDRYKWITYLREKLNKKGMRIIENYMFGRTTAYDDESKSEKILKTLSKVTDTDIWPDESNSVSTNKNKSSGYRLQSKKASYDVRHLFKPKDFNGSYSFGPYFSSHSPLWVAFMLGTNDLKKQIREPNSITAEIIAENVANMAFHALEMFTGHCHFGNIGIVEDKVSLRGLATAKKTLRIVIVVPPRIRLTPEARAMGFDEKSESISKELPKAFKAVCEKYGFICVHRNLSMTGSANGVHPTKVGCQKIAEAAWAKIKPFFPRDVRTPEKWIVPR